MNMIRNILALVCLGILINARAQEKILPVAQEMPTLQVCANVTDFGERRTCTDAQIEELLAKYLEYPEEAMDAGVDGFVVVRFIIDEKGRADEYTVDDDPGYGMAEAAIKAVKKFGKWVPGRNMGTPVKVRMSVPVRFKSIQQHEPEPITRPDVLVIAEHMPRYQGCDLVDEVEAKNCTFQSIAMYMRQNLVYPEEAKKQKVAGTVVVKFVVDETGMIKNVMVEDGIGAGCDEEAVRLVKAMPQWTPGMQDGKPVKVELKLPFQFMPSEKE